MVKGHPKFLQITEYIEQLITEGKLMLGEQAPSINEISKQYAVARETVVKAYSVLCAQGILQPVHGKGYFVTGTDVQSTENIFVLFDTLNAYKEILYKGITDTLGNRGKTDIYFHHFNINIYESLIKQSIGKYSAYFIMPFDKLEAATILDLLPPKKLFILDRYPALVKSGPPGVFQDFSMDIQNALFSVMDKVQNYRRILFLPGREAEFIPEQLVDGLKNFCNTTEMPLSIEASAAVYDVKEGDLYIVIEDANLASLIAACRSTNLKPGTDVGLISYNDTPLKRIIDEGITTVSTDFYKMGETIVNLLLNKNYTQVKNPSTIMIRGTL